MLQRLGLALLLALPACTHAQLRGSGDKMVRVERATQGVVDGVVAYKDTVKEECIAQNLATEAERAQCVERALAAVKASQVGVETVRAALLTFWQLYPVLDARLSDGGRVTPEELADLASRAAAVVDAYQQLIKEVQEAKR